MKKTLTALILCLAFLAISATPICAESSTESPAPVGVSYETTSLQSLRIYWENDPSVLKYYVAVEENREFIENGTHLLYSPEDGNGFFIKDGLSEGTTYYFRVGAEYGEDNIGWSDIFTVSVPVCAPLARFTTESLIALKYKEDFEYSKDGENWQKSNVFTGLAEYTEYTFYRRKIAGDTVSEPTSIYTRCTHAETSEERTEPTCTVTGSVSRICRRCGEILSSEVLAKKDHNYTDTPITRIEATESESGKEVYICSDCGTEKTVILPRIGCTHENTHDEVIKPASCTGKGLTAHVCDECGCTVGTDETAALPHTEGVAIRTEPSCITEGVIRKFCNVCGEMLSEETIPVTDHEYSEWYADANGDTVRNCVVCGKTEYETPPVTYTNQSVVGGVTALLGDGLTFSETLVFSSSDVTSEIKSAIGEKNYVKAVKAIGKSHKNNGVASVYSLGIYKDGEEYNGVAVSVRIPVSRFAGTDFQVYEITGEGKISQRNCAIADGYIVFPINSCGYYAIVDITGISGNAPLSGKTLIITVGIAVVVFLGGAGFAAYYMYSKFRREKSKEWLDDNPDMSIK